jgi:hypothetical protein
MSSTLGLGNIPADFPVERAELRERMGRRRAPRATMPFSVEPKFGFIQIELFVTANTSAGPATV